VAKPAPEAPRTKITASTGAAERLAIREEEAIAKRAAEAKAAAPSAPAEAAKPAAGREQIASLAPSVAEAPAPKISLYEQGRAAESSGQIKQAVRLYVRAVRAGEYDAAKSLGDIFADGKGEVTKDYAESLKYYAIAEKHGVKLERTSGRGR
jgi:eukaryotic-like serine/threonine-protein kinase